MREYLVGPFPLAYAYAFVVGVILVGLGLLGFVPNPIASEPASQPLFVTDVVHNVVHLVTGALALYIAFHLSGEAQANGVMAFGVTYGVILILLLLSPDLFGILEHPVNAGDHVLHAFLAVLSIVVGYVARTGFIPEPT